MDDTYKAYCFEILETPWTDDNGVVHDGFGVQLTLTEVDELRLAIETKLDALAGARLTLVESLCDDWAKIRGTSMKLESGSTGNVSGLTIDFEKEQARIRKLLQSYVNVYHIADAIKQKRGPVGSQGVQINFIR